MRSLPAVLVTSLGFIGCVLAANYVTGAYGMVPIGLGLVTTAGTFFAGATFVLRDTIQDQRGRAWVLWLIALGALLSFAVSPASIAVASMVAFAVSEVVDLTVYTPLRRRGYIRAAVASNLAGALVDTVLFLAIAGFPVWAALPGQIVAKGAVTLLAVLLVLTVRAGRTLRDRPV